VAPLKVVFERDESGAWIVRVPSVPGCHTHGRTLQQARRRVREALSLWVPDAGSVELIEDVRLPRAAIEALRRTRKARGDAEDQHQRAQAATERTARLLVDELDLSLRDAGDLVGLTRQRVQQLLREPEANEVR
jgi:predicted RNase H-like HicB family nuclease